LGSWRIPCAQGVSPLTVFIIAHRARVVKPFFGLFFIFFAPALRLPHLGAGALRPSCRPLRSSFQTPADAGSHLYPAQQDSVRSRTLSSRTYRLSWVLHPSPLRTFGLCLASLIYILIIPQVLWFVKHFFLTFFVDSGSLTSSDVCPPLKWGVRSLIPRRAQGRLGSLDTAIGIGLFGGDPLEPL
jgi:hypothetical protein